MNIMYENYDFTMCPMYAAARTCLSPRLAIAVGACARVGLRKYVFHATCKPAPGRTTSTIETHCLSNEIDETWSSRLTVLRIPRGDPFGNPLEELTAAHVSWSTCVTKTISSSDADRGYTALASGARVLRRVGTMWRLARGPGRNPDAAGAARALTGGPALTALRSRSLDVDRRSARHYNTTVDRTAGALVS